MVTTSRTASTKKPAAEAPATKTKAAPAKKTAGTVAKKAASVKKPEKAAAAPTEKKARAPRAPRKSAVTPEQRYQMIATAAYFIAERRGFEGGAEMSDWVAAELEIDARLESR